MERLVRIAATLKVAGRDGVSAERLVKVAGFSGEHAVDQLDRELRHLRSRGWQIDNLRPSGEAGHYRMATVDNRLRVRLTPAQQAALQRAALLADREDLVARLGLPAAEQPADVGATLGPRTHDERLSTVAKAVRHRCVLRFRYGGKDRVVHPESVRSQNEHWYLRGLEEGSDGVKAFVVSRMSTVSSDAPESALRVTAEPSLTLHPMRWEVDPPVEVTVRTTPSYRLDVVRWLGEPGSETMAADSVDMTYVVTNRAALRTRVFELGSRVELVAPDDVREAIVTELAAAAGEEPA